MRTKKTTIELGDAAKDAISGFSGIVTGKSTYLNGCTRFLLEPRTLKDGSQIDAVWFDVEQLVKLKSGGFRPQVSPSGGPRPAPTNRMDPTR